MRKPLLTLLSLFAAMLIAVGAHAQLATPPAKPGGVHFVYLIRHGIYDRDTTKDDVSGNGLNELGRQQARLVGARLAALPVKVRSLVCSNYARASETADEIGKLMKMTPVVDSLIHECTPNSDRPDYMSNHSAEDIALCESNLTAAWKKYFSPTPEADTRDVLVAHGNVIRWLVTKAQGIDTPHWTRYDIANCSITVIAVRPDGSTRLIEFSDTGHLPVGMQTWTGKGAGWAGAAGK